MATSKFRYITSLALFLSTLALPAMAAARPAVCSKLDSLIINPDRYATELLMTFERPEKAIYEMGFSLPGSKGCEITMYENDVRYVRCHTAATNRGSAKQWLSIFSQTIRLCYPLGKVKEDIKTWERSAPDFFAMDITDFASYGGLFLTTEDVLDDGNVRVIYELHISARVK